MTLECKLAYWSVPLPSGCVAWSGSINAQGYGDLYFCGGNKRAHRLAWESANGSLGPHDIVDHQCGNRWCVALDHLRVTTKAGNTQYRVNMNRNNSTGYRGVTFDRRYKTYGAEVMADGVRYRRHGFATAEEANECAIALRQEHHPLGEFAQAL